MKAKLSVFFIAAILLIGGFFYPWPVAKYPCALPMPVVLDLTNNATQHVSVEVRYSDQKYGQFDSGRVSAEYVLDPKVPVLGNYLLPGTMKITQYRDLQLHKHYHGNWEPAEGYLEEYYADSKLAWTILNDYFKQAGLEITFISKVVPDDQDRLWNINSAFDREVTLDSACPGGKLPGKFISTWGVDEWGDSWLRTRGKGSIDDPWIYVYVHIFNNQTEAADPSGYYLLPREQVEDMIRNQWAVLDTGNSTVLQIGEVAFSQTTSVPADMRTVAQVTQSSDKPEDNAMLVKLITSGARFTASLMGKSSVLYYSPAPVQVERKVPPDYWVTEKCEDKIIGFAFVPIHGRECVTDLKLIKKGQLYMVDMTSTYLYLP